jgi:hypothetical protein
MARPVQAQSPEQERAFAMSLVDAINSGSVERRKALMHRQSLVCGNRDTAALTDEMLKRQARRSIPSDFKWRIASMPAGEPPFFADKFDYPVRPTHRLQIDFSAAPNKSTVMLLQLVYDGSRFQEVIGCPKPKTIEAARIANQERARRAARVVELVAAIAPDLKAAVVSLYREGRSVEAIKHYAKVSGEELVVARAVVEELAGETR